MVDGGEVRIGQDGTRTGWLTATGFVLTTAAIVVVWVLTQFPLVIVMQLGFVLLALAGTTIWLLTRRAGDVVVLDDHGLGVEGRSGPQRWAWAEVLDGTVVASVAQ